MKLRFDRRAIAGCTIAAMAASMQLVAPAASASSQVTLSTLDCTGSGNTSDFFTTTTQVFEAPATGTVSEVAIRLYDIGSGSTDVFVSFLEAPSGVPAGTPGSPATPLATGSIARASISTSSPGQVMTVTLSSSVAVSAGETYALLFGTSSDPYGGIGNTGVELTDGSCTTSTGGSRVRWNSGTSSWVAQSDNLLFAVYVTASSTAGVSDDTPAPWLKAIEREAGAQCPEGMNPSWAMWPNNGTGGFTCEWREEYAGSFAWRERPGFYG